MPTFKGGKLSSANDEGKVVEVIEAPDTVAASGLEAVVLRIIEATAQNYSSMYQDVRSGRRTEVGFLLGQACRAARQHGLATPELNELFERLQTLLRCHGLPAD